MYLWSGIDGDRNADDSENMRVCMDSADRLQGNEKGNSLRIMRRKVADNERLLFTPVSISGVIDTGVNSNNERTYYPFTVKKYT